MQVSRATLSNIIYTTKAPLDRFPRRRRKFLPKNNYAMILII